MWNSYNVNGHTLSNKNSSNKFDDILAWWRKCCPTRNFFQLKFCPTNIFSDKKFCSKNFCTNIWSSKILFICLLLLQPKIIIHNSRLHNCWISYDIQEFFEDLDMISLKSHKSKHQIDNRGRFTLISESLIPSITHFVCIRCYPAWQDYLTLWVNTRSSSIDENTSIWVIWKCVCDVLELFVVKYLFIFLSIFSNVSWGKKYCILLLLYSTQDVTRL